jgi:hypothetical protein
LLGGGAGDDLGRLAGSGGAGLFIGFLAPCNTNLFTPKAGLVKYYKWLEKNTNKRGKIKVTEVYTGLFEKNCFSRKIEFHQEFQAI